MHPSLVGNWIFEQERPFVQEVILTIHADGRMVQFFRQAATVARRVASTMRATAEEGRYRVRTDATAPGYLISMYRDGDALVIENGEHRTVCRRLVEAELPNWYAETAAQAVWR